MAKRDILILDQELIAKIDENRGDLSRSEFVEFCVDHCLEATQREVHEEEEKRVGRGLTGRAPQRSSYATAEEFESFKQSVTGLLREFLDFFVTYGLELGNNKTANDMERLKAQLRAILEEKNKGGLS